MVTGKKRISRVEKKTQANSSIAYDCWRFNATMIIMRIVSVAETIMI